MATMGELRSRLAKTPIGVGVDLDLITGFINQRMEDICRGYPWTRLNKTTMLQTIAEYNTGTITIAFNSTSGTGSGTTFTSAMTGRLIRPGNLREFYTFTYVSATSFTVDRPYEDSNGITAGAYRIWQPFYEMPSDLAELTSLRDIQLGWKLEEWARARLDEIAPARDEYDNPAIYVPAGDSSTPLARIELYPGPTRFQGYPLEYRAKAPTVSATADVFPDWMSIPALYEGVIADLYGLADRQGERQAQEQVFGAKLLQMQQEDARRMPADRMKTSDNYTDHRRARTQWRFGTGGNRNWRGSNVA